MKRTILSLALMAGLSTSAMAVDNDWEKEAMDAWIDGKAEATLLFNGNLNSFKINTDVKMGKVVLTGRVDSRIDSQLAEELIAGIGGVKSVDNRLTVLNMDDVDDDNDDDDTLSSFTDAKISTVIKSRLLFDSEVSGTDIDVDVENGVVTLTGEVESDAAKQLAIAIANNASDVRSVTDKLVVEMKDIEKQKADMARSEAMTDAEADAQEIENDAEEMKREAEMEAQEMKHEAEMDANEMKRDAKAKREEIKREYGYKK